MDPLNPIRNGFVHGDGPPWMRARLGSIWYPRTRALATRNPASCPLAAGQARALAGWPRACIQSVSDLCMMHA